MNLKIFIKLSLLPIFLFGNSPLTAQVRSLSQDFTYTINQKSYKGDFRYEALIKDTNGGLVDAIANSLDFTGIDNPQIMINLRKLKLDQNTVQDFKVFILQEDHQFNPSQLKLYVSAREAMNEGRSRIKSLKVGNDVQRIKFDVLSDGNLNLKLAYYIGQDLSKVQPRYLNFIFRVSGTGNSTVTPEPTPTQPMDIITEKGIGNESTTPNNTEVAKIVETTKPETAIEKTPEEVAWEAVVQKNTILDYQAYINTNPKNTYIQKAQQAITAIKRKKPIQSTYRQDGENFTLFFENALRPKITQVVPDDSLYPELLGDSIKIKITNKKAYTLTIRDNWGKEHTLQIDNQVPELNGNIKVEETNLVYNITGGEPPYSLIFKDKDGFTALRHNLDGAVGSIEFKALSNLNGIYTVDLLDKHKIRTKTFDGIIIHQVANNQRLFVFMGLAIGFIVLFLVARYFYQKLYKNEFEEEF